MCGIPTHVTAVYVAGFAAAPLALFVPPPHRLALHASLICRVLLGLGLLLIPVGTTAMALELWWAGMFSLGAGLLALMLMFWVAGEPPERADEDDETSGGGGGGQKKPPPGPDGLSPDGLDIDWGEFDRQRETWRTPELV